MIYVTNKANIHKAKVNFKKPSLELPIFLAFKDDGNGLGLILTDGFVFFLLTLLFGFTTNLFFFFTF
jgi:hypothetical protein